MKIEDISWWYIINLARREDRKTAFYQAWQGTGLPFELFTACDGNDFPPPKTWDAGAGAWGCYLSHITVMNQAIRFGDEHFVILEDDARPTENFQQNLEATLADLPDDYDQLYLGWQALHTRRVPPVKLTDHLGRAGNINRNHATLWSRSGAIRFLQRLHNLAERQPQHHIDHWMGELHEELTEAGEHRYNSYIAIPQLCFQAAGKSDINGKEKAENLWFYRGNYAREYKPLITVTTYTIGYGEVGRRGYLGYEHRKADATDSDDQTVLSLHAPSTVWAVNPEPLLVTGHMNSTGHPREPVRVKIDGKEIGEIQNPGDKTEPVRLEPEKHCLEFVIPKYENALAHTYWVFRKGETK